MLWQWREVRLADWLLLVAFGAAALSASRNTPFVGLIGPVLIAGYWPNATKFSSGTTVEVE